MYVKIRTDEKCPVCKRKFQYINDKVGLMCAKPHCHTRPTKYYLQYFFRKQRKVHSDKKSKRLTDWKTGLTLALEIEQKLTDHKEGKGTFDPADYEPKRIKDFRFTNYVQEWLENKEELLKKNALAPSHVKELRRYTKKYFTQHELFKNRDIRELRKIDISNFRKWLPDTISLKTQKNIMGALHNIFTTFKEDYECLDKIPKFDKIQPQRYVSNWLDKDEQDHIFSFAPKEHYRYFYFVKRTGKRSMEAAAIQKQDINFKYKFAIIRRNFSDGILREITKQKDWGMVFLADDVIETCFNRKHFLSLKPTDFIFTHTYRGQILPYSHSLIKYWWPKMKKAAGIDPAIKLPFKDGTRHSWASQRLTRGVPLKFVSQGLDHHNQKITEDVYAHLLQEHMREVFEEPESKVVELIRTSNCDCVKVGTK